MPCCVIELGGFLQDIRQLLDIPRSEISVIKEGPQIDIGMLALDCTEKCGNVKVSHNNAQ